MHELDEVLARFQLCDLEYAGGLSNHGPMAAEALVELGHPALLVGFMDVYAPRLQPMRPGSPIAREDWGDLLGVPERAADWIASYETLLSEQPWREVVVSEIERLADGVFTAAGHGWLRVVHAVRALRAKETAERVRELAFGFGYWASHYQSLPGEPGARSEGGTPREFESGDFESGGVESGDFDLAAHLRALAPLSASEPMLFTEAANALESHEPFLECVETLHFEGAIEPAIESLCSEVADLYLRHPNATLPYIHALTVPSGLRLVSDLLSDELCSRLFGRLFQTAAAFHAIGAAAGESEPQSDPQERERLASSVAELRYRAACSIEEHAIKFAEACLREHSASTAADTRFLQAASDAVIRLDSGRY